MLSLLAKTKQVRDSEFKVTEKLRKKKKEKISFIKQMCSDLCAWLLNWWQIYSTLSSAALKHIKD